MFNDSENSRPGSDNDGDDSGLDGRVIVAALAGADVVVDRRTRTIHSFNKKARDAVEDLQSLGMGPSSDNDQMLAFLRALSAHGLKLFGITTDGNVCRLVDKADDVPTSDDEGG